MNKKQAYTKGRRAFEANPCGEERIESWMMAYAEGRAAGFDEGRDEVAFPAFREGYNDAHWDFYYT